MKTENRAIKIEEVDILFNIKYYNNGSDFFGQFKDIQIRGRKNDFCHVIKSGKLNEISSTYPDARMYEFNSLTDAKQFIVNQWGLLNTQL